MQTLISMLLMTTASLLLPSCSTQLTVGAETVWTPKPVDLVEKQLWQPVPLKPEPPATLR
jgi:hypothetical protein